MKVRISAKKIIIMWSIVFLVLAAVVVGAFFNLFFFQEFGAYQIAVISVYVLIMVVILIISLTTQYYEINKKDITEHKFWKKYTYFYSDIIYIDEKESIKSKALCFVTKYGHVKYLTFDKDDKIFEAAKNKCHDLKSLEEVKAKFPGINI